MPKSFQAVMQPRAFSKALTKVDQEAQRKQWKSSLAKFTRLLWSMDWEGSLRSLVSQPASIGVFGQWLSKESPNDAKQLELIALLAQLSQAPPEQQTEMAMQLCQRYMGQMPPSAEAAMQALLRKLVPKQGPAASDAVDADAMQRLWWLDAAQRGAVQRLPIVPSTLGRRIPTTPFPRRLCPACWLSPARF